VGYFGRGNPVFQAIPDGFGGQSRSVLVKYLHPFFEGWERFQVFGGRIKGPFFRGQAVVCQNGIPVGNTTLIVKEFKFPAILFIKGIYPAHEIQDFLLVMFKPGEGHTNGNDLAQ
jgi:hypothetical protein